MRVIRQLTISVAFNSLLHQGRPSYRVWLNYRQGLSVRYLRLPALFEQLRIAHGDGSYARVMQQLLKTELLILDDCPGACRKSRPLNART
jgi:hypothetical protein